MPIFFLLPGAGAGNWYAYTIHFPADGNHRRLSRRYRFSEALFGRDEDEPELLHVRYLTLTDVDRYKIV